MMDNEQKNSPTKAPIDQAGRTFAAERSHKNAEIGYEHAKAAAQSAILINGGAATAILAFLTDNQNEAVRSLAPAALSIYAVGVIFGAGMMYALFRSNHYWNMFWQGAALHGTENTSEATSAQRWRTFAHAAFGLSALALLIASLALAFALSQTPHR